MGNVTKTIQFILQRELEPELRIDGLIGPATMSALGLAPWSLLKDLRKFTLMLEGDACLITVEDLQRQAWEMFQDERFQAFIELALPLENHSVELGSDKWLLAEWHGTFRGFGQFNKATWDAIERKNPQIGDFPAHCNVRNELIALYSLWGRNKRNFHYYYGGDNEDFTPEIGYLFHNQGAPSAKKAIETGKLVYPKQSSHAVTVMKTAVKQGREMLS